MEKWKHMEIRTLTSNTITDIDALLQDIALTRQRNYALDMEESEYGVYCIGTALLNYNRQPIGAISLSSSSMTAEEQECYGDALLQQSKRLSNMLGYSRIGKTDTNSCSVRTSKNTSRLPVCLRDIF